MERPRSGRFGVPDDTKTLNGLMKIRRIHKRKQKATQFVHAAKVLNLDIFERQMFDERLKEVPLVIALDEKLNADSICMALGMSSAPQDRGGLRRRWNPVHR